MIVDNHVHVGWYTDGYHSPREIWNVAQNAGVDEIAVSSTSTCTENYKLVCREIRELIRLGGEHIHPILWLTPRMMKFDYLLSYVLHQKFKWFGVKLHFAAHPEWTHNMRLLRKALNVATKLNVPILIHTGMDKSCHAGRFDKIIHDYDNLIFVLAHGRPINEAIDVMIKHTNVYVDTAFMPSNDIFKILEASADDRLLFGTDYPINNIYIKDIATTTYIKNAISEIKSICGNKAETILSRTVY